MALPVTEIWQATPGDVIDIPGHFAGSVTVISTEWDDPDGDHLWLEWTAPRAWGHELFTSLARISLVSRAPKEN